jgi:glutaminyl-peptide cyclotransferase
MRKWIAPVGALLLILWSWGCGRASYQYKADEAVYHQFSGDLAYAHVEKLVAFGPRPAGSKNLETSRKYMEAQLKNLGWTTTRQSFEDETPKGPITFVNLRARFHGSTKPGAVWTRPTPIVIGSHYDTKFYADFEFVGANDGGSSTGALLEIARVAAKRSVLAEALELVFFDGEEAFNQNINDSDGLYGSRFYAKVLRKGPAELMPTVGLVLDMIGDKDLNIGVPADSPHKLYQSLMRAAKDLNYQKYFGKYRSAILDDHVPLNHIGIPTIDIIDLDYGTWHTAEDTMEHVSAESLKIVGSTALLFVEKYLLGEVSQ